MLPLLNNQISLLTVLAIIHRGNFVPQVVVIHRFDCRSNSVKINDRIFQYIEKTLFLAHFGSFFPILRQKNFFRENPDLPCTTSYEFLAPWQISEKTNDTIPRKHLEEGRRGWKDGQTLFYRTFLATSGSRKNLKWSFLHWTQFLKIECVMECPPKSGKFVS